MTALARLTSPDGATQVYVCHDAPGHTPDASRAIHFATDDVAYRAAHAAIYGDPNAFWRSERNAARLTRARMRGWRASIVTLLEDLALAPPSTVTSNTKEHV